MQEKHSIAKWKLNATSIFVPFHRVEEYINTGHDKNVIDPDKIDLKRKERKCGQLHENKTTECTVTFPDDG
jgi:hypothetical protein